MRQGVLLTRKQQQWLDGDGGPALQWAMHFNESLGNFYRYDFRVHNT
jgi:hypothetical protein